MLLKHLLTVNILKNRPFEHLTISAQLDNDFVANSITKSLCGGFYDHFSFIHTHSRIKKNVLRAVRKCV